MLCMPFGGIWLRAVYEELLREMLHFWNDAPACLCAAGLGLSVPDAISAAQGAGAAAKAGNCPQAVIALNLAQSSPDALTSADPEA